MPRISLSMIVKNEGYYLEGCLRSVEGIVDEIVVVDTGSTDDTMDIAARYGARVLTFPWKNDFAEARNESLSHCSGEWILYLDADERISPDQGERFRSLTRRRDVAAYTIIIQGDHYLPSGVVRQVNAYPRLFRRHPRVKFEGSIHEQVMPSIQRIGGIIAASDLVIDHLGYGESLEKVRQKCRRNIELLRARLGASPDDAYARYHLGNTLTILEEFADARTELLRVEDAPTLDRSVRGSIQNILAEIDIKTGRLEDARVHLHKALHIAPRQVMARWHLSGVALSLGQPEEARAQLVELLAAAKLPRVSELAHDITVNPRDLRSRLAACFELLVGNAAARGEHAAVEVLANQSDALGVGSYKITRVALQAALARSDTAAARKHVTALTAFLPETAGDVRQQLERIADRLGAVPAFAEKV